MTNNDTVADSKSFAFQTRSATKYLWCGCSEHCHCSHHISDHSRNDDSLEGRCTATGCPCVYFQAYRDISDEEEQQEEEVIF